MAVSYNPDVIAKFARRLYMRAIGLIITHGLMGFAVSAGATYFGATIKDVEIGTAEWVIAGMVGALLGVVVGEQKGFALRLQAQIALCQVQIERNTRPGK